jgi:hypothetical protein
MPTLELNAGSRLASARRMIWPERAGGNVLHPQIFRHTLVAQLRPFMAMISTVSNTPFMAALPIISAPDRGTSAVAE